MALKTDTNSNENLVLNGGFSSFIESGQILLLNEPLMVYTQENIENDCAIVLDPISDETSQNLNLPEIIFDGNYYQFENLQNSNFSNDFELHEDFHCVDEGQQVDDGLAVLEILCNNSHAPDQPEFVDVSNLTEICKSVNTQEHEISSISISDDDDVVFVREYKEHIDENPKPIVEHNANLKKVEGEIRRNPVRKVRTRSRDLSKEHIFEEDFAFLDTSEEDEDAEQKENKAPNKKPTTPNENFKEWPVNAHERPEYNIATKKIEAFDYTIREIQKRAPNKKPRLETVPVRRKPKKKYFTRKRKPRVLEVKKYPIEDIKALVNSTTQSLKDFLMVQSKESRELINPEIRKTGICCSEKILEILKSQTILFCIVNDLNENDMMKPFKMIDCSNTSTKK